ncbi:MAG: transaldolase [Elusimicrobia bacterium RIFOXYB2_FULL_48_7]|nr:MAG: transaldolase [Elusimicrobia bacterium RIFOXYB2_FULL_48_7]
MKLFIDSVDLNEIKQAAEWGLLGGVTTNPSLMSKKVSGLQEQKKLLAEICKIAKVDVLAEPVSPEYDGILKESIELAAISPQIVAKLPMTPDSIRAVGALKKKKIKTAITLIFSPAQAMIAAVAGADYICPFVGRLDDNGVNGIDMIGEIQQIYGKYGFKTRAIVASVRNNAHILGAAKHGAAAVTIPFKLFSELFRHDLTDAGIKKFLEDWNKAKKQ